MLTAARKHFYASKLISRCLPSITNAVFSSNSTPSAPSNYKGKNPKNPSERYRPPASFDRYQERKQPIEQYREKRPEIRNTHELKTELEALFAEKILSKLMMDSYIYDRIDIFDGPNLANLMRMSGKLMKFRRDLLLKIHLPAIARQLESLTSSDSISTSTWSYLNISYIFFGLQRMKEKDDGVIEILTIMTRLLEQNIREEKIPMSMNISMILMGLQKSTGKEKITKKLLDILTIMIDTCPDNFDSQHIGNILYGIQSMSSDCPHVRTLLTAVTKKIELSEEKFETQNVSMALNGLKGMSSEYKEVRDLLSALVPKIHSCTDKLKAQEIANCLSGLQSMFSTYPEVRSILKALEPKILQCKESLQPEAVGDAMFGLQGMHSNCPEVVQLLLALAPRVVEDLTPPVERERRDKEGFVKGEKGGKKGEDGREGRDGRDVKEEEYIPPTLDARAVGNALYGLRNMSSEVPAVRHLIAALTPRIISSKMTMNAHNLGFAFYGLQGMTSSKPEVRALLSALTPKILECSQVFSADIIGDVLYRMRRMSSDSPEVRDMISALTPKIKECNKPLSARGVGISVFGMQGLNSSYQEVRDLISAIIPKIDGCKKVLSAKSMGYMITGLQELSSEHREVRELLLTLVPKIQSCDEPLTADMIGKSLYGLQGINSQNRESRTILLALIEKINGDKNNDKNSEKIHKDDNNGNDGRDDIVSAEVLGKALYGLNGIPMEEHSLPQEHSLPLYEWIYTKLSLLQENTDNFQSLPTESLLFLCQQLALNLPSILGKSVNEKTVKWSELQIKATTELEKRRNDCEDKLFKVERFISVAEKRIIDVTKMVMAGLKGVEGGIGGKGVSVSVEGKQDLFGLIECDVVLRVNNSNSSNSNSVMIDIEIGGVYYVPEKKKSYCMLRDNYLSENGVIIERLDLSSMRKMKDPALAAWIKQRIEPHL